MKEIDIRTHTELIPNINLFKKIIKITETTLKYRSHFLDTTSYQFYDYTYIVDENDQVPYIENFFQHRRSKQTVIDIINRVNLNMIKYFQPYNFCKTSLYLYDTNWIHNECILLEGKKCHYFTMGRDPRSQFANDNILFLQTNLSKIESFHVDNFLFDVNPYYISNENNIKEYL